MRKAQMIESLEPRALFSLSVTTIGATSGVTAAAATKPVIVVGPNVAYFNAVEPSNTSAVGVGGPHSVQYQLRVKNTGTKNLIIAPSAVKIEGVDKALFSLVGYNNTTGAAIKPGKQIYITIQFTANNVVGIKTADIRIVSNAPNHPISKIPLRGLVTAGEGTTLEPSLQTIFNLYQLGINAGEKINTANPYFVPSGKSDEVDVQTFTKAVSSKNVSITPLAEFTNHSTPDVRMGFYTPGVLDSEKYVWYSPTESSQSLAPLAYGQTSFDPGSAAFGLVTQYPFFSNTGGTVTTQNNLVRNVYSETALNKTWDNTSLVHMKFYPYIAGGKVVKNTYIVAEEEYSDDSVSDSQDLIFIVSNVTPAGAKPTLSYENLTGYPSNDTMSFNTVQIPNTDVGNIVRTSNILRIGNSGTEPLVYTTGISGDFSIGSGGGSSITVAAAASKDISIKFTATKTPGVHSGFLTLTTNDPTQPTVQIALHGNWQQYSEMSPDPNNHPSLEPNAPTVVNQLLGYQTNVGTAAQLKATGGDSALVGSQVAAQYFTTADTSAAVRVVELAAWHSVTFVSTATSTPTPTATNSFLSWYKQGSTSSLSKIFTDKKDTGQMVLPVSSTGTGVASGSFHPGTTTFGFSVENLDFSDHSLNPNGEYTFRFFPAYDEHGVRIANSYIVLHDYDRSFTNFDYQDEVYLISNIMPVGALKTPRTVYAQSTAQGNLINFTSPDDGPQVTGFNVFRATTPQGVYTLLNSTPLARHPSGTYIDASATPGTTYYYAVTTVGNGGVQSDPYVVQVN